MSAKTAATIGGGVAVSSMTFLGVTVADWITVLTLTLLVITIAEKIGVIGWIRFIVKRMFKKLFKSKV